MGVFLMGGVLLFQINTLPLLTFYKKKKKKKKSGRQVCVRRISSHLLLALRRLAIGHASFRDAGGGRWEGGGWRGGHDSTFVVYRACLEIRGGRESKKYGRTVYHDRGLGSDIATAACHKRGINSSTRHLSRVLR